MTTTKARRIGEALVLEEAEQAYLDKLRLEGRIVEAILHGAGVRKAPQFNSSNGRQVPNLIVPSDLAEREVGID